LRRKIVVENATAGAVKLLPQLRLELFLPTCKLLKIWRRHENYIGRHQNAEINVVCIG